MYSIQITGVVSAVKHWDERKVEKTTYPATTELVVVHSEQALTFVLPGFVDIQPMTLVSGAVFTVETLDIVPGLGRYPARARHKVSAFTIPAAK